MATALFNGMEIRDALDDCNKPFRFTGALEVLKNHDKFQNGNANRRDDDGVGSVMSDPHNTSTKYARGSEKFCEQSVPNSTNSGSNGNFSSPGKPTDCPVGRKQTVFEG